MVVIIKRHGGGKDTSWAAGKNMLNQAGFLKSLIEFNLETLDDRAISRVEKNYLKRPEMQRDQLVKDASAAAYGLLQWVKAMVNVSRTFARPEPGPHGPEAMASWLPACAASL